MSIVHRVTLVEVFRTNLYAAPVVSQTSDGMRPAESITMGLVCATVPAEFW